MSKTFSELFPQRIFDVDLGSRKALTLLAVLRDFLEPGKRDFVVLDLGASSGAVANHLADSFAKVVGVDVDHHAIGFAARTFKKPNLTFSLADGMNLPFRDRQFDAVTCAHIYEHVEDPHALLSEIYRVLKTGGICYFAAANRLWPLEFHYRLLFLAWLPPSLANLYLKMSGRGNIYDVRLLGLRSLRRLVKKFSVIDYTQKVVDSPDAFDAEYLLPRRTRCVARIVLNWAYWLFPTYIWILKR